MKKLLYLAAMTVLAVVLLSSCKKDKDDDDSANDYFSYNGTDYDLEKGMLIPYGQSEDGPYEFEVWLYGGGLTIFNPDSATGTGNAIGFALFCNPSSLASGTYPLSDTCCAPMTIWGSGFFVNWNADVEDYPDYVWTESGSVDVSVSGSTYEFHFNLVAEDGKTVKGNYKGSLTTFTP